MPSLGLHMTRARVVAKHLGAPEIDDLAGVYYFGATAPDIRVITRRDRSHTHFFTLECMDPQDSVARMLEVHPELARPRQLDPVTRAFMLGYVTHLALDEVYIETMYRDYFGERSTMAGDPFANVLDRALQFEMNRRELEDGEALSDILEGLRSCQTSNAVSFIEDDYLAEWREVIVDMTHLGPSWDRFPRMMNIHLRRAGLSDVEIERYARNGPALAQQSLDYVSEERVARFIEEATRRATEQVERYLGTTD